MQGVTSSSLVLAAIAFACGLGCDSSSGVDPDGAPPIVEDTGFATDASADAAEATTFLAMSTSSDRSSPVALDGRTVSGPVYVFLLPEERVDEVAFYIDDPAFSGAPFRTEIDAPFDLRGASPGGASPWDTSALEPGEHQVSAIVTFDDTTTEMTTATFTTERVLAAGCGNGVCEAGETGLSCTDDCTCSDDSPPAGPFNTGLSDPGALTAYSGPMAITSGTYAIENAEVTGTLRISGASTQVTIRNSLIYAPGSPWTIYVFDGATLLIEDSEIGKVGTRAFRGIGGNNITARRVSIHHHEDGIKLGSNCLYDTVWIHDLDSPAAAPHADALQAEGTSTGSIIRNSTLDALWAPDSVRAGANATGGANAAVILKTDIGPQSDIEFNHVYLNGGNYVVFLRDGGNGSPSNIRFIQCLLGPDQRYGTLSSDASGTVFDVYDAATCAPID